MSPLPSAMRMGSDPLRRPFISSPDVFRDQMNRTNRESFQFTTFVNHDFTKSQSKWAKLLGRHTLSGLFFKTVLQADEGVDFDFLGPAK